MAEGNEPCPNTIKIPNYLFGWSSLSNDISIGSNTNAIGFLVGENYIQIRFKVLNTNKDIRLYLSNDTGLLQYYDTEWHTLKQLY